MTYGDKEKSEKIFKTLIDWLTRVEEIEQKNRRENLGILEFDNSHNDPMEIEKLLEIKKIIFLLNK